MAIFATAYDTTAASGYVIKDTKDKLKIGMVNQAFHSISVSLTNFDNHFEVNLIEGGNSTVDTVPYFNHPVFIGKPSGRDENEITFIDVRNFGKWFAPQQKFVVRNSPEYSWHVMRGVLNHVWNTERVEILRDISIIPAATYAALISECVARKFALDPGEQIIASIVACYYYYCLFSDDKTFNEHDLNKTAANIARATRAPAGKVFDIISDMPVLNSLDEMCMVLKEKTQSIRLTDFNIGVLLAVVSGNWFGTNARENIAVGLEHIPTWLMICYAALNEATFKRSVLAKLVERFAKGGAGDGFIKSMDSVLDTTKLLQQLNATEG